MERKYAEFAATKACELLAIDSPSGYTRKAATWVKEAFEALGFAAKITTKGGVLADLGGADKDDALFLQAHTDTLGAMVAEIKANGRLKLTPLGGLRAENAETENVRVHTRTGKIIEGTVQLCNASVHVNGEYGEAKRTFDTVEEAAALDDKLISAWTGHPHLRIIDNTLTFEDKMKKLIAEIASFLGEPEPYEIERKYLIEYPDIKWLESNPACQRIEIIQTYLNSTAGEEVRVRQRGIDGNYIYYQTIKKKVSDMKRVEVERRLSQAEYLKLLMLADTTKRQIRKTRYCLTYENQYFEIDVYPFWSDKAIAEIELSDENTEIVFPKQIKVIKEVTDDDSFKNASLAQIKE